MDRRQYLVELYKYMSCVEDGYGSPVLPANPPLTRGSRQWFQLSVGYIVRDEEYKRGYIILANSKDILSNNTEKLYFRGNSVKTITLTDDQIFRFFVAQAVPKYEARAIERLGKNVWDSLENDYRKIAIFSLMYNTEGYFSSCMEKVKTAMLNKDWNSLAKYQYDCGAKKSNGKVLQYLKDRRTEEAYMIRTNTLKSYVSFRCKDSKRASNSKLFKYRSFLEHGNSLDKLWNKWSNNIQSPLDVTLLLNPPNVGVFNTTVPYCFDAGSELHLALLRSSLTKKYVDVSKTGDVVGVTPISNKEKFAEANWALSPQWSSVFVDFVTINNGGQYISDQESLSFDELVGRNTDPQFSDIVSFKKGIHFGTSGWTQRGIEVLDSIKRWPGGLIYHDNHVEVLLHMSKNNGIITCAGNVSLPGEGRGVVDSNFVGIKSYKFLTQFTDENQVFVIKRGTNMAYTNGLGISIKRTSIFDEYEQRLRNRDQLLTSKAFDLLQDVMEEKSTIT